MRHVIIHCIVFFTAFHFTALGQGADDTVSQAWKGWPGKMDISDLENSFRTPPPGYGNVPFYWWTGDRLDSLRLREQLEILADASTDGLCISYNHTHCDVDLEINAPGHGNCGRVSGGEPRIMSGQWWEIWNDFSARCAEKGIGLGMDDYVIAWPGNGEFIDSILNEPSFKAYQGRLVIMEGLPAGKTAENSLLRLPDGSDGGIRHICTAPAPWLHPDFGKEIVRRYFQPFEDNMDENGRKGMNYFFQDELQYDLHLLSWCEDMPRQFLDRKGYDIVPLLPALFKTDASEITPEDAKVRLDYAEVLTCLAEERYFKPLFDWHAEKGLIYGCDPESRGLNPLRYLDYFRAMSWFTAPGNDAPARGSSFRQTKVSSSIAHLYGRPRTWLEAFHSMGWDANGALLKRQLDHHIIAGGNLLCMHGLYYSTHGGWWEWAPPCFHFRMPYWPHMKLWLKYAERMCFLLSQGSHVCDVAILYPTETMQAIPGSDASSTFAMAEALSATGLDYDFIDYQSLQKADIDNGSLHVRNESYKVLVLSGTKAVHSETLANIRRFIASGGLVIAENCSLDGLEGTLGVNNVTEAAMAIRNNLNVDFRTGKGNGRVLHRRIGNRDVYMVMDVEKGDRMHFRSRGAVQKWDALTGNVTPVKAISTDSDGIWVKYDGESDGSALYVFAPGETAIEERGKTAESRPCSIRRVTGEWDITIVPTMDNRWGDFRLPASDGFIGVEARRFRCFTDITTLNLNNVPDDIHGYGPYMEVCRLHGDTNLNEFLDGGCEDGRWSPYVWSWQYGVPDSPGSQGWHGLKSKVDSRFLILDHEGHMVFRTWVLVPSGGNYRLCTEGVSPTAVLIDGKAADAGILKLRKGWHRLTAAYGNTGHVDYSLRGMRSTTVDFRQRSMVILFPENAPEAEECGMYDDIVASKWFKSRHLVYDLNPGPALWHCQFETAPGTREMSFRLNGVLKEVRIDGKAAKAVNENGLYRVRINDFNPGVSAVTVTGIPAPGYPGPAFFDGPVGMECSGGRIPEGDWTQFGALACFSGGIRYSKDITLDDTEGRLLLDLGSVDATCEVSVNGSKPEVLIGSPYRLDITESVRRGSNHIEVLVYSSLSNHYSTIPSPYRGTASAGLLGPVQILQYD